jgi:hypothetical protein
MVNEARLQLSRRRFDFESVLKEPDLEVSNLLITGKSTSDVDHYREDRGDLPTARQLFANVAPIPGRFRQVTATGPGSAVGRDRENTAQHRLL